MIRFDNDYSEGTHPEILKKLAETNLEQTPGYGEDPYCKEAAAAIRKLCDQPDADVHFLVGGTQANLTVIASMLRPHQGVVSAHTGHIATHESGAIEATGHKVITVESPDGKLTADRIRAVYDAHWEDATHEHMAQPGMVYISHPTESGTTYTKKELEAISALCRSLGLPLYLDGARLACGLMAEGSDLSLPDIASLCDAFYIGGTKSGALFGEAVVLTAPALKKDFRYLIKQRGGMLAKGRLLGLQFGVLFKDGLYFRLGGHAVQQALRIRKAFADKGFPFLYDSMTNQQFPILPDAHVDTLAASYAFHHWEKAGEGRTAVRFCTSWATRPEDVDRLIQDIAGL